MATIRLDNIFKPRQLASSNTKVTDEENKKKATYTDVKLDLKLAQSVGSGLTPSLSKDIIVSEDIQAIRNSIYNIFSTKSGEKLLNPLFGSSLEQYLFENVSSVIGQLIGDNILNSLQEYEPRIEVLQVTVVPKADDNQYNVKVNFRFREINKDASLDISINRSGQIIL
jgi:phage baseplate assembly protein W